LVDKTVATSEFGDAGKDTSVKKRRVRKDDWAKIEKFVKNEHEKRENSNFRRDHERKWKEVDRQLRMEEMVRVTEAGQKLPPTWHHIFELGELSKASEIICADVRRITFPRDRSWFEAHVELPLEMTEQGPQRPEKQRQKQLDGVLRSFMVQQHMDFGFKSRVDLSIKEALHHGMFVAEAEWQQHMMVYEGADGGGTELGSAFHVELLAGRVSFGRADIALLHRVDDPAEVHAPVPLEADERRGLDAVAVLQNQEGRTQERHGRDQRCGSGHVLRRHQHRAG
jgi:hypothetical protein